MVLVILVIDLIEGERLLVVYQLRRDVIGCKDCKKKKKNDCCFSIRLL